MKGIIYFDNKEYNITLQHNMYEKNIFIQNLLHKVLYPFEKKDVDKIIQLYYLGTVTNSYMYGSMTIPFIDIEGKIRAVQTQQFDEYNRSKNVTFLHTILKNEYFKNKHALPKWLEKYTQQKNYISCLFGEHLLSQFLKKNIILVKYPKTAIIATLYYGLPEVGNNNPIWLAGGCQSYFTFDRLRILEGRGNVTVIPEISKNGDIITEWENKAAEIECKLNQIHFDFKTLLENKTLTDFKKKEYDISDTFIKLDWKTFRNKIKKNQLYNNTNHTIIEKIKTEDTSLFELSEVNFDIQKLLKNLNSIGNSNDISNALIEYDLKKIKEKKYNNTIKNIASSIKISPIKTNIPITINNANNNVKTKNLENFHRKTTPNNKISKINDNTNMNEVNNSNSSIQTNTTIPKSIITNSNDHFEGTNEEWEAYLDNLEESIKQSQKSDQIEIKQYNNITTNNKLINDGPNWNKEVSELEKFFDSIELPIHTIWVNEFGKLKNVSKFVKKELMICKTRLAYNGITRPYANLNELKRLKKYLEHNKLEHVKNKTIISL